MLKQQNIVLNAGENYTQIILIPKLWGIWEGHYLNLREKVITLWFKFYEFL